MAVLDVWIDGVLRVGCSVAEGINVRSTDVTVGKVLHSNGDDTSSWVTLPGGGDALIADPLSQFASTTSLQLSTVISDETGIGSLVFSNNPALVNPTGITTGNLTESTDKNFVTDSESVVLGNTSGTNTGDQIASTVTYDNTTSGLTATNVKTAIDELSSEKDNIIKTYVEKTANYTLLSTDYQVNCTANSFTISLPTAVGITGKTYSIKNSGIGNITIDGNLTETIDGELTQILVQYDNLKLMSTGASWIII